MSEKKMEDKLPFTEAGDVFSNAFDKSAIQGSIEVLLRAVGEDPDREGLLQTPERVARMYHELLKGYRQDPVELVNDALFKAKGSDMVVVRDIEFYSLCEHHLLPFMGHAYVAYIPNSKIIGLSKIPRIVDMFSHRLQVQERLTRQIAEFLNDTVQSNGVGVVIEALHLCSMMRGVRKQDARMTTSTMLGTFRNNDATRMEFLNGLSRGEQPNNF